MHALHSTLLPSSAVHHALYLANFTPSTIYPLPLPPDGSPVQVIGNLVVAGGQDLRVFEIREQTVVDSSAAVNGDAVGMDVNDVIGGEEMRGDVEIGDSFFDAAPVDRAPVKYETKRTLHLLCQHELHGTITGLAALRTIESTVDGLDRLLVSFKHAKMALLEWSRGDVATVSLHTYERSQQILNGDLQGYVPLLRADPLSRLAILTLPEDSLAVLPLLQDASDLDPVQEAFARDLPYSPSYVLALSEVSADLRNVQDVHFLPGFHSPTLALLHSPVRTWAGRYHTAKDAFHLEIRTFDSNSSSYPLLTSAESLPADSLYLVPCPPEIGGVVVVTSSGLVHVDQAGRTVAVSVNAWWAYATRMRCDSTNEARALILDGSRAVFVTARDMLLVLQSGEVHQVRIEMDGRAVGAIKVDEQSSTVPPPSSVVIAGTQAVFVGCAEGDSLLAKVTPERAAKEAEVETKPMEVDLDEEDLYGESSAAAVVNGAVETGPVNLRISEYDVLAGVGRISDMEFGIAVTDQGARTYPQLLAVGGGSQGSTFNVFRRGIPITKRRRFDQLAQTEAVWFLPVQRPSAQQLRDIPEAERATMLVDTEAGHTRIYALSGKANQVVLARIPDPTIAAGTFFQRTVFVHVTPTQVALLDTDAKLVQMVVAPSDQPPIVAASIADPFLVIRRADGSVTLFSGDSVARSLTESATDDLSAAYQVAEVFTDATGVYRTFEAQRAREQPTEQPSRAAQRGRTQLTDQQIKRLQEEKPAIAVDAPSMEMAMNAARGTQWLAVLTQSGELQIRSLPDLKLVLQSTGLATSDPTFTDDLGEARADEEDRVQQLLFCPIGTSTLRPHVLALHHSGRLNVYEAQPRFTVDASTHSRRSLAVRFRKVHTQLLPTAGARLPYTLHSFHNVESQTGAFVTGEKPQWIMSSDAHPIRAYALKQAAFAFGKTTHLGGRGEYFIRIEDGSFICYLQSSLNTDFVIPCDRYKMARTYVNVAFDPTSGHYVGATGLSVPFQAYDEEGEIQLGPSGPGLSAPTNERASLELFSAGADPWRVVDGYEFAQNEAVLCVESVSLESASSPDGRRDFIAVGTGKNFGEDRATSGAVYIFEVVETVGETAKASGWRLKFRCKDVTRNPVTAMAHTNGYLIHANGPKILAKGLDYDDRLMGLAFMDTHMYITSMSVFKNLILVGDFVKSLWLAALSEAPYKIVTISRDTQNRSLTTGDFLVQDGQVTFITTDRDGDLRMLDFDPSDPDSLNGERMIMRTEFHTGTPVTCSKTIARRRTEQERLAPQTQIVYATADGALTTVVSVKAARFKRLQLVQDQLVRNAQHVAGLNPRAFRAVRNDLVPRPLAKGVLDGGLLEHFARQPAGRQREMMRQIGTDAVTVASDLQALGGFW
ncbi:mRNA cleavage and polyadenylation factor subunit [Cryptotrichosporon argae]